jgi:hypothetical protein
MNWIIIHADSVIDPWLLSSARKSINIIIIIIIIISLRHLRS